MNPEHAAKYINHVTDAILKEDEIDNFERVIDLDR